MRLSDAGHNLMPMVEKLVQQETEIDFRLRDASDLREGNLRIGATGPCYIMDTVRRYRQRYPGIDLAALDIQGAEIVMHEYLYCLRERQPVQLIARFLEMAPAAG